MDFTFQNLDTVKGWMAMKKNKLRLKDGEN